MNRTNTRRYVKSVTDYLETHYHHDLIAVILFGSVAFPSKDSRSTDVDLLIVMHDRCSDEKLKLIKKSVFKIERKLLIDQEYDINLIRGLQSSTGMFTNCFVCRLMDFEQRKFSKVFSVNLILSAVLAPQNSVWMSLLRQHRIVWGKNVFTEWPKFLTLTKWDITKSFMMTWLLATGALALSLVHPRIIKFSMEAVKWSLFTWRNYHNAMYFTPLQIVKAYKAEDVCIGEFLKFRNNIPVHPLFPFWAWRFILRLHFQLFMGN
ncbi:MAG: hypothetical protein ACFFE8_07295 [Candidatus Heimdallarchaeota archaeon]